MPQTVINARPETIEVVQAYADALGTAMSRATAGIVHWFAHAHSAEQWPLCRFITSAGRMRRTMGVTDGPRLNEAMDRLRQQYPMASHGEMVQKACLHLPLPPPPELVEAIRSFTPVREVAPRPAPHLMRQSACFSRRIAGRLTALGREWGLPVNRVVEVLISSHPCLISGITPPQMAAGIRAAAEALPADEPSEVVIEEEE